MGFRGLGFRGLGFTGLRFIHHMEWFFGTTIGTLRDYHRDPIPLFPTKNLGVWSPLQVLFRLPFGILQSRLKHERNYRQVPLTMETLKVHLNPK